MTPKEPPPAGLTYVVRLKAITAGSWFSVSCEVCHQIVIAGEGKTMGVDVRRAVEVAAPAHMHEGV